MDDAIQVDMLMSPSQTGDFHVKIIRRLGIMGTIAGLMLASYSFGAAEAQNSTVITKLDQSYDFLVKGRALLASIATRRGAGDIDAAKAAIDTALAEIESAKAANGG